ncbi:MAG: hypothetical protein AAFZ52_18410, partial [Bacteroidota bacterium]
RLDIDPKEELQRLRSNVVYLRDGKETLLPHARNYLAFVEGYAQLLALRRELGLLEEDEKRRRNHLRERRPEILASLAGFQQESGDWLRDKLAQLR